MNDIAFLSPDEPREGYYLVNDTWDKAALITKVEWGEIDRWAWLPLPEGETPDSMRQKGYDDSDIRETKYRVLTKHKTMYVLSQGIDIATRQPIGKPDKDIWNEIKRYWHVEADPFKAVDMLKPLLDGGKLNGNSEAYGAEMEPPEPAHPAELIEGATFVAEKDRLTGETKSVVLCDAKPDGNPYSLANAGKMDDVKTDLQDMQSNATLLRRVNEYSRFMMNIAKREMEIKMEGVRLQLEKTQREVDKLNDILYTMQLFMGDLEQIELICEGEPAPDSEPVHVYQGVSYTEEDFAYYDHDFDHAKMHKFIDYCKTHPDFWKGLLPHPKSILGCKPCRNDKKYSENAFCNWVMNRPNHKSFFLIRNGDRLYRLDAEIALSDRVCAAKDELQKKYDYAASRAWDRNEQRDYEHLKRYYTNISALIRGILYRSDVLAPHKCIMPELPRIVLNDPMLITIYDLTDALSNGKPSFDEWHAEHVKDIKRGSRILVNGEVRQVADENAEIQVEVQDHFSGRFRKVYEKYDLKWLDEDDRRIWSYENGDWRAPARRVAKGCNKDYSGLYDYSKIDGKAIADLEYYARSRMFRSTAVNACRSVHQCINAWKQIQNERANFGRFVKDFLEQQGYELNDAVQWDSLIEQELKNLDKLLVWKRTLLDHADTNFRIVCRKVAAKRNAGQFRKMGVLPF